MMTLVVVVVVFLGPHFTGSCDNNATALEISAGHCKQVAETIIRRYYLV